MSFKVDCSTTLLDNQEAHPIPTNTHNFYIYNVKMKFQVSAALMGLAVTAVSAQYNQTGPFNLHIKGQKRNSKIDGKHKHERKKTIRPLLKKKKNKKKKNLG